MIHTREEQLAAFNRLLDIQEELRIKCPWDRKQTMESLRSYTIEEVYELAAAIMKKEPAEIKKELGDVLEHVIFYSIIGSEDGSFDIADVCNSLCDKLIFRHPHIYGHTMKADTEEQVERNWEQLKLKEKGGNKTVLGGIPEALPTMVKAYRIQDKAANAGFDWEKKEDVWEKVKEEIEEFEAELRVTVPDNSAEKEAIRDRQERELGDLLFSIINVARLYKLKPDNALEKTNVKFIRRFNYMEERAKKQGRAIGELSLEEMETLWQEARQS